LSDTVVALGPDRATQSRVSRLSLSRLPWRKIAAVLAIALATCALLYGAAANIALSTHWIAKLVSRHPDRLKLQYGNARTFWPGRVHLQAFDLRGREPDLEWQLHIDTVDVDLSLLALLHRRFHVAKVVATGVTFRQRFRLDANAVNLDRVARMPPIQGFDAIPLLGVPPRVDDANAKPWTVDIQGVDARAVREVWIDAYRVFGFLEARGGFSIGGGRFTLAPATADVSTVALVTGDDPIATDVTGGIDAEMQTTDLNEVKGAAILRSLTMRAVLRGTMGGIAFIRHFVPNAPLGVSGGVGSFESDVRVVHGVVAPATTSRVDIGSARVVADGRQIDGGLRLELSTGDADETHGRGWSRVDLAFSGLAFTEPGAAAPAASCKNMTTRALAGSIDLADPETATHDFDYSWATPRLDILDLHSIDAAFPKDSPFRIERGAATVEAHGAGSLTGATADVEIDSTMGMQVWGASVTSGVHATIPVRANFLAPSLDFGGSELVLSDPSVRGWWSKIKLGTATVRFRPPAFALALSLSARDAAPFLNLYRATAGTSPAAKVGLAIVPNALIESMTANCSGAVRMSMTKGALDLDRLDVHGHASRLRGFLRRRGERSDGDLLVEAGPTALGVDIVGGKTSLVFLDAPAWFATKAAAAPNAPIR
jgi:hypothetical protein